MARAAALAAVIVFIYLIIHCFFLHYTFRNVLLCIDKYRLNKNTNKQAAKVYYSSITFYSIRTALNIVNVFADVIALTALVMSFVNGIIKSRSRWLINRICYDVRDALAMFLGGSIVLTIASGICRTAEIYVLIFSPYDTVELWNIKQFVYIPGRFENPEYSANAMSRYVGISIINCLITGFKAIVMMRVFDLYDDLWESMRLNSLLAKCQQELAAMDPTSKQGQPSAQTTMKT